MDYYETYVNIIDKLLHSLHLPVEEFEELMELDYNEAFPEKRIV